MDGLNDQVQTVPLSNLSQATADHVKRLDALRKAIHQAHEEVFFHESMIEIAQNPRVAEVFSAFASDWDATRDFADDPRAFIARRQIGLPQGVSIDAVEIDEPSRRLTIHLTLPGFGVHVVVDKTHGIAVSPRRHDLAGSRQFSDLVFPG